MFSLPMPHCLKLIGQRMAVGHELTNQFQTVGHWETKHDVKQLETGYCYCLLPFFYVKLYVKCPRWEGNGNGHWALLDLVFTPTPSDKTVLWRHKFKSLTVGIPFVNTDTLTIIIFTINIIQEHNKIYQN